MQSETQEPQVGQRVVIIGESFPYFADGTKATLVKCDDDAGGWWAAFRGLGNPEGSFKDTWDAVWFIGEPGKDFRADDQR